MRIFVPGFRCFLHQVLQTCALLPEVASEATISAELRIFDSGFRHFVLVQSERQLLGPVLWISQTPGTLKLRKDIAVADDSCTISVVLWSSQQLTCLPFDDSMKHFVLLYDVAFYSNLARFFVFLPTVIFLALRCCSHIACSSCRSRPIPTCCSSLFFLDTPVKKCIITPLHPPNYSIFDATPILKANGVPRIHSSLMFPSTPSCLDIRPPHLRYAFVPAVMAAAVAGATAAVLAATSILILAALCPTPTSAWGGVFNRFSPEMLSNLGYGAHGANHRVAPFMQVGPSFSAIAPTPNWIGQPFEFHDKTADYEKQEKAPQRNRLTVLLG